jgi:hypothetical protein
MTPLPIERSGTIGSLRQAQDFSLRYLKYKRKHTIRRRSANGAQHSTFLFAIESKPSPVFQPKTTATPRGGSSRRYLYIQRKSISIGFRHSSPVVNIADRDGKVACSTRLPPTTYRRRSQVESCSSPVFCSLNV